MAHLKFKGGSNILTTIPPACGWLKGKGVHNKGNGKSDPADDVVEFPVVVHPKKIYVKTRQYVLYNNRK